MTWGTVWLLALAVSIDGFSAGLSCGLRKLSIPFTSLAVICCSSSAAVALSMFLGGEVALVIPPVYVSRVGGAVLILLGLYVACQNVIESSQAAVDRHVTVGGWRRFTDLVRRPEEADLDRSGVLSTGEALLLGAALAADAFAAGFGAGLMGASLLFTVPAVGLVKMVLVPLGLACGRLLAKGFPVHFPGLLSGAILVLIGLINIL